MVAINLRLTDEQKQKLDEVVSLLNKTGPPGAKFSLNSWMTVTLENEADKLLKARR